MNISGFMKDSIQMSIEEHSHQNNIFQQPIWGFFLEDQKYACKDYIDYILNLKENNLSIQKSNFGGWHSSVDLDKHGIFQELCDKILHIADNITQPYRRTNKVKFTSMWAMINDKYNYNAHHVHEGLVSGIFYLQVPENSGRLVITNPAVRSQNHPIRVKDYPVQPEKLALIMFPSWMEHYVEPSKSDEQRIGISFNIGEKYE